MDAAGLRRIAIFVGVGGSSFVLDLIVVGGLKALGVDPLIGRAAAFAVGLVYTWLLHRRFTFETRAAPSLREFAGFAGANAVGIGLNYGVYALALWLGAHWALALMAGTSVGSTWNYLAYRRVLDR